MCFKNASWSKTILLLSTQNENTAFIHPEWKHSLYPPTMKTQPLSTHNENTAFIHPQWKHSLYPPTMKTQLISRRMETQTAFIHQNICKDSLQICTNVIHKFKLYEIVFNSILMQTAKWCRMQQVHLFIHLLLSSWILMSCQPHSHIRLNKYYFKSQIW